VGQAAGDLRAPSVDIEPPVMRIGIAVDVERASLAADSGVVIYGGAPGAARVSRHLARATFVAHAPEGAAVGSEYRIQVAAMSDGDRARALAAQIESDTELPSIVQWSPLTETYNVRIGEFGTRQEAEEARGQIERAGFPRGDVVEEPRLAKVSALRLLETGELLGDVLVVPERREEDITLDGQPYRGVLEVRPGAGLTVVNVVNLEDYLRGVVPNEMSPKAFPRIEALKAQAVAARTYALESRGKYQAKGFDLCATPRCQFYRGKSSEQPETDRAVMETRGQIVTYHGKPINALYTSTCGGHTEDAANVFEGKAPPYLRGVVCMLERDDWRTLGGRSPAPMPGLDGRPEARRDAALLLSLGVIEPRDVESRAKVTDADVERWVGRLVTALRRAGCAFPPQAGIVRRGAFFHHLVGHLCWDERARRLLSAEDSEYLLHVEDRDAFALPGESMAAALLVHEGILKPSPENLLEPGVAISRADAIMILARTAERAGVPGFVDATFRTTDEDGITVSTDEGESNLPVDPSVRLFRMLDGTAAATSELLLVPGEQLRYIVRDGKAIFLEAHQSLMGVSNDRNSRYYRWETRLTPDDVARGVERYGNVGKVQDLVIQRRGVSGRVAELLVRGSEGEVVVKGIAIRFALGLKDTLFVIDRELAPGGGVAKFIFTGKGWGHGVGLCQVGAYGMARAGYTHEQILQHYYPGTTLQTME
jgi:stage II sporulation protein D